MTLEAGLLALVLTQAAAAGSAVPTAAVRASSGPAACLETGYFRCRLPASWTQSRSARLERVEKVYGLEAAAPEKAGGAPTRISVDYFAAGNAVHKDLDAYIAAHTRRNQAFRLPGEKYGPVTEARLGGSRGRAFERETSFFWPPDHPQAKRTLLRERFIVLPARGGFFALSYSAPAALYEKRLPDFEALLGSFVPLR